jgi:hypothetical protein
VAERSESVEFDDADVKTALASLDTAPFRSRVIRTDCNAADPEVLTESGQPIDQYARGQLREFKATVDAIGGQVVHSGVFQKFVDDKLWLAIGSGHLLDPITPEPRDLFHVYGPDRDSLGEWRKYFRYAWKDEGPNAIVYTDDATMIRDGKLAGNCYSYTGQNSFLLLGVGMLFRPEWGDAMVSVRPYTQWQTSASFTGNDRVSASASASLGIFVESWKASGGGHLVERDITIPVWSQTTSNYLTHITNGGAATVTDGLATDFFAVTQRKYAIFVYAWLETSAAPQQVRNEIRYTGIDIDVTVPYVVVEETLN